MGGVEDLVACLGARTKVQSFSSTGKYGMEFSGSLESSDVACSVNWGHLLRSELA